MYGPFKDYGKGLRERYETGMIGTCLRPHTITLHRDGQPVTEGKPGQINALTIITKLSIVACETPRKPLVN